MNTTDSLSEKSCNSLVFEEGAKAITFACFTTEDVKGFPLLLGEVGTNKVVAPENMVEAKEFAKNAEKLRKQGVRITTKEVAEKRIKKSRNVSKATATKTKSEDTAR
ncbi:MAG: hypothetical protein ACLU8Y_04700 [Clostridia bacterium]